MNFLSFTLTNFFPSILVHLCVSKQGNPRKLQYFVCEGKIVWKIKAETYLILQKFLTEC